MWKQENRPRYNRDKLRYPSDLTDPEWSLVESLIPPAKRGGRRREVDVREILNGIMYVLSTGCQWRYVPGDLPPRSTIHGYLQRWDYDGTLGKIHYALYQKCREQVGREASPTACIIDSQSVKSAEKGGPASIPRAMMRGKVRLEGAHHLWRKVPSGELSIDPEADELFRDSSDGRSATDPDGRLT